MTKIAFVQGSPIECLGMMCISACLKKAGHEVMLFIESEEKDFIGAVSDYKPDMIGFTVMSGAHKWCLETAGKLKRENNIIIFGGPHPTFFPDVINEKNVDVICVGEGEHAMLEMAAAFPDMEKISKIRNLHVKFNGTVVKNEPRDFIGDLDAMPYPDRELVYRYPILRENPRKIVMTNRGCPYSCTFCFNSAYRKLYANKGRYVRMRSKENIIGEIIEMRNNYPLKSVYFSDDTFIIDKAWLTDMMKYYKERVGLPFVCLIRADLVDEDVIRCLKEAGCISVHFGIESGNETIRNMVLKKGVKDAQIYEAARLLKKYGIKFKTYNILGLPGETMDNMFETVGMNAKIRTDYPWASILVPYPKTELSEMMVSKGLLGKDYCVDDIPLSFFNKKNPKKVDWPIMNLQRLFFFGVKFPALMPLIRRLIYLPPNPLFTLLFFAGQTYSYKGSENTSWACTIQVGLKSLKTSFKED